MRNLAWLAVAALAGTAMADEAAAVKALEKVGGRATRDTKLPGKPVVEVFAANMKKPAAGMKAIKSFAKLRRLNLINAQVTDEGLKGISALKELTVLQAYGNKLTRVALKEIGKITQLTRLDIGNN